MNDIDKKKAKVTPEQLEECRKLRGLYDQRIAKIGKKNMPSQERIGVDYGIGTQSMVGHFLGGRSALTATLASACALIPRRLGTVGPACLHEDGLA